MKKFRAKAKSLIKKNECGTATEDCEYCPISAKNNETGFLCHYNGRQYMDGLRFWLICSYSPMKTIKDIISKKKHK